MKKIFRILDIALFAYVASLALILGFVSPSLNWDVIGYVGAAKALGESDPTAVHQFTFAMIQGAVLPAVFQAFITGPDPHGIFSDPHALFELLPFYQIRIGYILLVRLLSLVGVSMVTATFAISAVSVALTLVLLFYMSRTFLAPQLRIVIPLAALAFGFTDIARMSTPDGLALLTIIGCCFLFLKNEVVFLQRILPLLGLIRTDLSLFSLAMLVALFTRSDAAKREIGVAMVATVAICIGVEAVFGHPGWATILYVTLVQPLPYPISSPPTVTPGLYLKVLVEGLRELPHENGFLVYVGLSACCVLIQRRFANEVRAHRSSASQLGMICAWYILIHFVALPVAWDRFFAGPYIMGIFALLAMLTERTKATSSTPKNAPSGI